MFFFVKIVVIDNGICNFCSVIKVFEVVGVILVVVYLLVDIGCDIDGLMFFGVGVFGDCVVVLCVLKFDDIVCGWIVDGCLFFGVCFGM